MNYQGGFIREATEKDRQRLANLIHYETYVHRHLDWRPPLDWLGFQPFLLWESSARLLATLACPPDPPEIAWIRLFGVLGGISHQEAWSALWPKARAWLSAQKTFRECLRAAAVALQPWFRDLIVHSGFEHTHDVIVLTWEADQRLPLPQTLPYLLRPMTAADLEAVCALDTEAFAVEWRNSRLALEVAFAQAALATVVADGDQIIAYQISTAGPLGAHLARLAVRPAFQGRGVGYALVYDLLEHFRQRSVSRVTVNTQSDNLGSLALYHKAGFWETGEVYQVYQLFNL